VPQKDVIFHRYAWISNYSLGRWGAWLYWNMDKIYEDVMKLADKIPLPK